MRIILASDLDNLGRKGDVVAVADGYARNFLLPKGLAIVATKGALRQADQMRRAREEAERRARDAASRSAALLRAEPVYISARAGDAGRLFGSVTKSDVARAIHEQLGEDIDRHQVRLDDPIRSVGTHQVSVHVHDDINAPVTVEVIPHEDESSA